MVGPCFLTYFLVHYDPNNFSFEDFCTQLDYSIDDAKNYGTEDDIFIGYHYGFVSDLNEMVRDTLKQLFGKEDILLKLKEKYNLEYKLERVPTVSKNYTLNLSLAPDIIEFLYKTQTIDDLDYFIDN